MPLIASSSDKPHQPRRKASLSAALRQLTEGTEYGRRQAALDLAACAEEQTDEVLPALLDALARETDGAVRDAILQTLMAHADDSVIDRLIYMLRGEDAAQRNEAVTALQQRADLLEGRMPGLLADPDPDMRIMAIDVLRLLPDAHAPGWLRHLLSQDDHPNVIGNAVDRMAEIGGPDDLPALRAARDRFADVPYIRFAADMVIARIETLDKEGRS